MNNEEFQEFINNCPRIRFKDWECQLIPGLYHNGNKAINLIDSNGSPVAKATVNIENSDLEPDEISVKDWAENEGMFEALIKAGIISDTGKRIPTGFVEAKVGKLITKKGDAV